MSNMEKKDNKNTIKAVILIVLALITIGSIIFGTYRFTGNVKNNIEKVFNEHGISINGFGSDGYDWEDDNFSDSGNKSIEGSEEFSNLKIDAKVMSITIKNGDKFNYCCRYNKDKLKPEVTNENGTLKIVQHGYKNNNGNLKCNLEITVPRYTQLDDVYLELNVGEINLEGFDCNTLKVTNNVGEIDIEDINFEELEAKTNVGELSIRTMSSLDEYKINAETNIGELRIGNKNHRHSYSQNGSTSKRIKAVTNVGEVSIR